MYRRLLVPIDDTDLSIEVVGNAVGFARAVGAHITFFHAVATEAGAVLGGDEPLQRDAQQRPARAPSGKAAELLAKAAAAARAFGVPCDSKAVPSDRPAAALVEAARGCDCDLIFMAAQADGDAPATAPGIDTVHTIMKAGLPVLVSGAAEPGPSTRAIGIIRDEHRALAAVLHAWMQALARARSAGVAADAALMRAIVRYIESFASAQHDANEDEHLCARLRARTHALNAELDELQRQHVRGRRQVAVAAGLVEALAERSGEAAVVTTAQLDDAVRSYASFVWEHLGREEGVILPAAQRHLDAADWSAIEAAFARNPERRFDGNADADAGSLFAHIVTATQDGP